MGMGPILAFLMGAGARRRSSIVLSFPFGIQRSVRLEGNVLAGGGRNVSAMGRIGVLQSCSCSSSATSASPTGRTTERPRRRTISIWQPAFDRQRFNNQRSSTITIEEAMHPD